MVTEPRAPRFQSGQLVRLKQGGGGARRSSLHYRIFGLEQRDSGWLYQLAAIDSSKRRTAWEDKLVLLEPQPITEETAHA